MSIKFANAIVKEIENRGSIHIPKNYVAGEAYEAWLYQDDMVIYQDEYEISEDRSHICITVSNDLMNNFLEDYGDAA